MRAYTVLFSGDLADAAGQPASDLAWDLLDREPGIQRGFLNDQLPRPDDPSWQERLYSLEIQPHHLASAEGIVSCRPWLKASAFANGAGRLIAFGRAGIGYDKIDLAACTTHDVVVFNAPYGLTHSTASAALFLILGLSKRFPMQQRILREHRWDLQPLALGEDLAGLTLGIVGLGHSAWELLRLIAPFGMRVVAYSPHADRAQAAQAGVSLVDCLDQVLTAADYLSLHCRLTEQTRRMLGARELGLMKSTAFLVNVARGELVDEEALAVCLRERRIAGAGLDVFETEPLPRSSPLLVLDNVLLTPHWLASTRQAGRATMESVVTGMLAVVRGQVPEHVLNPEVLDRPGFQAKFSGRRPTP